MSGTSAHQQPKLFVISLPRTGTRSTDHFFFERGLKTVHWPAEVDGVGYERIAEGHEGDSAFVASSLAPVIAAYDVMSDVPFPAIYRELAARDESSKFILFSRNPFDWLRSIRRHHAKAERSFTPFERVLFWRYFPSRPKRLADLSDRDLLAMQARHLTGAIEFFADRPDRLGIFDLTGNDVAEQLAEFTGQSGARSFANINRRPDKRFIGRLYRRIAGAQ